MQKQLKNRTKKFAIQVIHLSDELPNNPKGWVIEKQIIRSSTSVTANELISIFVSSVKTIKKRLSKNK